MNTGLLGFGFRNVDFRGVDLGSLGGQDFRPGIGAFLPTSATASAAGPTGALGFGLGQFNPDISRVRLCGGPGLHGTLRTGFSR